MSAALELIDVSKTFGRVRAVDGLSLEVPEGSLFGLIGPNGAGKTTTFGLIAGFLRPSAGTLRVRGRALGAGEPRVGHIVALPQDAELPRKQTALEALVVLGRLGGLTAAEARARGTSALSRVGLGEQLNKRVGQMSHGQRRRVQIAQTLLGEREIILLDEPTAGLDPLAAAELRQLVRGLAGERTIVLSSHNLAEVEQLCDRAAIIAQGQLVSSGTMDELRRAGALVRVLLVDVPAAGLDGVLALVRDLPGVRAARAAVDDPRAVDLEVADEGADTIASEVLKRLLGAGVLIRGVERGKSLEARFLEDARSR
jgi:ABC-type multidrug transport system ATPase subunit